MTTALAVLLLSGCAAPAASPSPSAPVPTEAASSSADVSPSAISTASIEATPTIAPTEAPTPTPTAAAFPVTVTDDEGTEITIDLQPERIVSLSPANTEIVFALGLGDRLVGGTAFDDYPPEAADATDVATFEGVVIEQVVDLDPDVILAAGNNFNPPDDLQRLRELGFPVVVLYAETVDEVLADIELIGQVTGASAEATQITEEMRTRIEHVEEAVTAADSQPRVFYQIGSEPEIYAPAPDSFIADLIVLAGGDPITTADPAVFSISLEQLIDQDPEVIVVGDAQYGVCPDVVKARPNWDGMTAVKDDAVRPIDDIIVTRPGPRLAEGLASLAVAIHPDLELEDPPAPSSLCSTTP